SCYRVWYLLPEPAEEPVRRAAALAVQFADSNRHSLELAAGRRELERHPIVWAEGGYALTDAATLGRAPIAALEVAVLAVVRAVADPVDATGTARFAAFAEAADSIKAGPATVTGQLSHNVAALGSDAAGAFARAFRQTEQHRHLVLTPDGWHWE